VLAETAEATSGLAAAVLVARHFLNDVAITPEQARGAAHGAGQVARGPLLTWQAGGRGSGVGVPCAGFAAPPHSVRAASPMNAPRAP
jgi:hypothetical protein